MDTSEGERASYDPRREARRQLARVPLPEDVQAHQLDRESRKELLTLAKDTAETVARHLVMAGRLVDDDPVAALAHARAARALAGRVAVAREANGLVAYAAGEWAEALTELRTARRLSGDPSHLPVIADCERALGRPDRALMVADDPQAAGLDAAARVELLIVASGARRDLGQSAAAAASLQVGALEGPLRPWTARLRYAYADALLDGGREDEAREWFGRAAEVDPDGETDAVDRLLELDGIVLDEPDLFLAGEQAVAATGAGGPSKAAPPPEPRPPLVATSTEPRRATAEGDDQDPAVVKLSPPVARDDSAAGSADAQAAALRDPPWRPTFSDSDSDGAPTFFDDPSTA